MIAIKIPDDIAFGFLVTVVIVAFFLAVGKGRDSQEQTLRVRYQEETKQAEAQQRHTEEEGE